MYRILHLFRDGVFVTEYIDFINKSFKDNYHEFWVYGHSLERKGKLSSYRNVKHIRNIEEKLNTKKIYEFDKIIYHGVFDFSIIDFFSKNRKLLKRLYLYFWGGDKFYINDRILNLKKNML